MNKIQHNEIWKRIPPEEKLKLLSNAQSQGFIASISAIILGGALSVGFHNSYIFWTALLCSPLFYHATSSHRWRRGKPKLMLTYLAARSVVRRYAYKAQASDLGIVVLFRGVMSKTVEADLEDRTFERSQTREVSKDVWISLFNDTVVIISESIGGAQPEFVQPITRKFRISGESPSGESAYSRDRIVLISAEDNDGNEKKISLKSDSPAALVVFEQKITATTRSLQEKYMAVQNKNLGQLEV